MPQGLLVPEEDSRCLAPDLQQCDPGLVEPQPHREPGPLVEVDRLAQVPDGQQQVVETEQLVRLVI